jgi:hypothetical protein
MNTGGLLGLTKGINSQEQANQDLRTMAQMLGMKKMEEAEQMQAEEQINATIQKVRDQTNMLLENDRLQVNSRAQELRQDIRKKLRDLGGDRKAFLKNGGMQTLRDYESKILDSDEFLTFKNNKINMEKILMVKESGKGHLLNQRDVTALTEYQANGKGKITYTGLNHEVEIDPMAFEYGQQVTPAQVIAWGNNRQAILANFEADMGIPYPHSYNDALLQAYVKKKGYGGIGMNQKLQARRMALAAKAQKDLSVRSVAGSIQNLVGSGEKLSRSKINDTSILNNEAMGQLGAKPLKTVAYDQSNIFFNQAPVSDQGLDKGLGIFDYFKKGTAYKLRGGAEILSGFGSKFAENYYGVSNIAPTEEGTYNLNPTELQGTFDAKGSSLQNRSTIRDWNNNYKPQEIIMAYKGTNNKGEEVLITDKYADKNGKKLADDNHELYGGADIQGSKVMVVRMHDPKEPGFDYYQEIPASSQAHASWLNESMGKWMNTTDERKEALQRTAISQEAEMLTEKEAQIIQERMPDIAAQVQKQASNSRVFTGPEMSVVQADYMSPEGQTRNALIQSFVTAVSQGDGDFAQNYLESGAFTEYMKAYGVEEMLHDYSVSDEQILEAIYKATTKPGSEVSDYQQYELLRNIYQQNKQ